MSLLKNLLLLLVVLVCAGADDCEYRKPTDFYPSFKSCDNGCCGPYVTSDPCCEDDPFYTGTPFIAGTATGSVLLVLGACLSAWAKTSKENDKNKSTTTTATQQRVVSTTTTVNMPAQNAFGYPAVKASR
ncbi:uncharacterized protein LOC101864167 [Aplysia californica]|uniref:Uncharacterized protein LOC101864167 n=1 Tax=Aplysia californica TaxID=6500 RepID=A0ABM0JZ81_APLCA|nr:uncharacterized protein LOC101864167 [Aplysia californica]